MLDKNLKLKNSCVNQDNPHHRRSNNRSQQHITTRVHNIWSIHKECNHWSRKND